MKDHTVPNPERRMAASTSNPRSQNGLNAKIVVVVISLAAASLLAGCHTIHGAGQDIERGGEKIQESAS